MRAMLVVFFFSRASVLRVRMSSLVQGSRLATFFAIHSAPLLHVGDERTDSHLIPTPTLLKKHFLLIVSSAPISRHCLFKEVLLGPLTCHRSIKVTPP